MRKQDQLLELINTLTASEKRYFKVFCKTQTGNKNYVALFDELENAVTYDATQLSKKLKVSPAALANDKEYLQEVLLRSLRLFHENNSIESSLQADFMEASILLRKGLVTYCVTLCNKIVGKAIKIERFTIALNANRLLSMCYANLRQYDEMRKANERETQLLEMLAEYSAFIHLRDTLIEPVLTRKGLAEVEDISKNKLFNKPTTQLKSFHARLCQGEIGMFYYQYIRPDAKKALHYALMQYEEFKANPHFIPIIPSAYYSLLSKLCVRYHGIGNFKQALFYIDMLISETEQKGNELKVHNTSGKCIKMTLLTLQHQFEESASFGKQHYTISDEANPAERITFLMDYALSLFHTGNYNACHEQLQKLIDGPATDRLDIQLQGRLLFIILQVQLKNYSLVPYQTKSLKGWMKKTKANATGAVELISWLEKLAKADAKHKIKETFVAFNNALRSGNLSNIDKVLALTNWTLIQNKGKIKLVKSH